MKVKNLLIATVLLLFTIPSFAQQPDLALIPYRHGNLWGYANPDKTIAIKPAYDEAGWFVGGYAAVKKGNKYGYINRNNKLVIPYKFYSAKPFMYGYFDNQGKHTAGGKLVKNQDTVLFAGATLRPNAQEVCIDTRGRVMSKCPAINENIRGNRQQIVSIDSQKVYSMVSNGTLYDKLVDDYKLAGDDHTYYIGVKNNLYGVINNTQDIIVPFEYASIKKVDVNGSVHLQVMKNGLYGMYTGTGATFIPVEKNRLSYVKSNEGNIYFIESKDGITTLRDNNSQDIVSGAYTDIAYDDGRGFILTSNDNTKGYYFLDKKLIGPRYSEVRSVRGGNFLLVKTKAGKTGYVNAEGTEFFDD
jgi:hypothetical protein